MRLDQVNYDNKWTKGSGPGSDDGPGISEILTDGVGGIPLYSASESGDSPGPSSEGDVIE